MKSVTGIGVVFTVPGVVWTSMTMTDVAAS